MKFAQLNGYKIKVINGYQFSRQANVFRSYIDSVFEHKSNNKNPVLKSICKLLLNSLLGRFGLDIEKFVTKIVDENIYTEILATRKISGDHPITNKHRMVTFNPEISKELCDSFDIDIVKATNKSKLIMDNSSQGLKHVSVAISAAVTAYDRIHINKLKKDILSQKGNIYYSDTDSIVTDIELSKDLVDEKAIGKLKLEHKVHRGYFISGKTYCLRLDNGKVIIKSKGMISSELSEDDFINLLNGNTIDRLKTMSYKNFYKGSVIIDEVPVDLCGDSYEKRQKLYNCDLWTDTKPLIIDINDNISYKKPFISVKPLKLVLYDSKSLMLTLYKNKTNMLTIYKTKSMMWTLYPTMMLSIYKTKMLTIYKTKTISMMITIYKNKSLKLSIYKTNYMMLTLYITKTMLLTIYKSNANMLTIRINQTKALILRIFECNALILHINHTNALILWNILPKALILRIFDNFALMLRFAKRRNHSNALILWISDYKVNNNCNENSSSMWNNLLNTLWYISITMLGLTSLIFYFINICENTDDESFIHEDINVDETVIDNDNTEIELSSASNYISSGEPIYHKSNKVIITEFSESDSEETVSSIQSESNGSESSVSEYSGSESRGLKRKLNLEISEYEDFTHDVDHIDPDSHVSKYRIYDVDVENKSLENHLKGNSNNSDAAMHPSNGKWIDENNDLGLNRLFSNKQGTVHEKTDSVESLIDKYYYNQNSDEE